MIKTILVPVMGNGSDDAAFWTALAAARVFGAHLEFLLVRPDLTAALMAVGDGDFGTAMTAPQLLADLEREDRERVARARRFFDNFCERERIDIVEAPPGPHGISAAWREEQGKESSVVVHQTRSRDLLVICPPRAKQGFSPRTIEAALVEGGRPMLLAAPKQPRNLARTIVVAWKDTPEAARAVAAAMPFLTQADKVIVLTIGESSDDNLASAEAMAEQLRWHRFEVEAQCLAPDNDSAPQTLVKAAGEFSADLVVMGGFGHSRVREMIFGGFTRHVLKGVELPVLLFH